MYGMINREVNRHNYGLAMSDARMAEVRKIIYRMVQRWEHNDKVRILTEYGDANLLKNAQTASNSTLNKQLTETIIINMDAE